MLRTSLRSVRALGTRPAAQWQVSTSAAAAAARRAAMSASAQPDEVKIPASETLTAPSTPPPAPSSARDAVSSSIPPSQAPLTPPAPEVSTTTITPPPAPPLPKKKKKGFFRRLRNFFLTLTLLGALGFGGGVWYSRINDNFHDFFTEYVPYGEQAVLYLEENEFKKRFPNVASKVSGVRRGADSSEQVKIPAQSGASWRVADGREPAGRQSSALAKGGSGSSGSSKKAEPVVVAKAKEETAKLPLAEATTADPHQLVPAPKANKKEVEKKPEVSSRSRSNSKSKPESAPEPVVSAVVPAAGAGAVAAAGGAKPYKAPEVDEPSRWPPASPIDPLAVPHASDTVVQDLVRMLNDIITVINHDGANDRYGATIGKAKNEVNKVGDKIRALKAAAVEDAAKQVAQRVDTFDKAANELVSRLEATLVAQEQQFQAEFQAEMERLRKAYDNKVDLIQQRERDLAEEKLRNQLIEQSVQLQRQFARDIKQHVEAERGGRLGKLGELTAAVANLESLTAGWNEVVDANLRTQQLHVAVEAVRASLEDAHHPRPFIKELVALKEIAAQDPVVDAAIASIHPSAYQRGIPTSAELIDRFRRVAGEVRKASLLPDDAGVASHASSYVLSKVLFKKQGLADGDDVESILTRTQTFLEEGDLDNAAREMNGLKGWSKTLSRDWLGEVRKVLEVRQALEVIQTEARLQSLRLE
ncbi:mitochondrial inner membrane protein Mitofilin [Chaetomium sp. MPI-SDFR-AT-0129]|nr:mitochondrial inner membrane protein Mitofilin [Chaetomium sp. MPI-SDFR-AT-0129]